MEDPFAALFKTLQPIFHLEAMRNGKYTYTEVQQLKDATDNYNPNAKNTFLNLLRAIREAIPYIEKWRINFETVKKSIDELANIHNMPEIDWSKVLTHPKISSRFQFSALNHSNQDDDLLGWLTRKIGKSIAQLSHSELTQTIIDYRDKSGFSQKLNKQLNKNPEFLFELIIKSPKNFGKIVNTRLILYLTDEQLAKAIIQHMPDPIHQQKNIFDQVEQLINHLNSQLSNGRSVSTLLRNSSAKPILEQSSFFQIYQSDEYKNRNQETQLNPTNLKI